MCGAGVGVLRRVLQPKPVRSRGPISGPRAASLADLIPAEDPASFRVETVPSDHTVHSAEVFELYHKYQVRVHGDHPNKASA